jgi:hypothetical protein
MLKYKEQIMCLCGSNENTFPCNQCGKTICKKCSINKFCQECNEIEESFNDIFSEEVKEEE